MVLQLEVEIEGFEQDLRTLGDRTKEIVDDWLVELADELQRESYRGATLDLAAGWDIVSTRLDPANPLAFSAEVNNVEPTASYRVAGRGPGGFPNIENLRRWLAVKGIPQQLLYPIGNQIAAIGTERFRTGDNFMGLNQDGSLQPGSFIFERVDELVNRLNAIVI